MFKKRSRDDQSNFWISYADLMAGLLFVFILLIGAIVSKSIIMREDLYQKEEKLGKTEVSLMEKMEKLDLTEKRLQALTVKLDDKESLLRDINDSLVTSKMKLHQQEKAIAQKDQAILKKETLVKKQKTLIVQKDKSIAKKKKIITEQEEKIRLQAEEVQKLHLLLAGLEENLLQSQTQVRNLDTKTKALDEKSRSLGAKVVALGRDLAQTKTLLEDEKLLSVTKEERIGQLQALITLTKDSLKLKESELEKLNQLLLARNSKVDTLNKKIVLLQNLTSESNATLEQKQKKLQEYVGRVIVLSNTLTDKEQELKLKDQKLATMLEALDNKKTKYDDLVAKLQSQRAQIKSLTGIRLKVISALKETLGNKINIDRNSGALRLASNILFDKGSSDLKEGAKTELRSAFEDYIGALVSNEAIRPHLDRIVVEGHTDSDGTYLYNLKLSQERALAVMNYLLTLPIAQRYHLKKYLLASGRAYQDRIIRNGAEDKDASRRIEIKFQLKNQDAMHEIERILGDEKQLF